MRVISQFHSYLIIQHQEKNDAALQECLECVFGLEMSRLSHLAAIVKNKNKD